MKKFVALFVFLSFTFIFGALGASVLPYSLQQTSGRATDYNMTILTDTNTYLYINFPLAMSLSDDKLLVADEYPDGSKIMGFEVNDGNTQISKLFDIKLSNIWTKNIAIVQDTLLLLDSDNNIWTYDTANSSGLIKSPYVNVDDFDIIDGKIVLLYNNSIYSFGSLTDFMGDNRLDSFLLPTIQMLVPTQIKFVSYGTNIADSDFFIAYNSKNSTGGGAQRSMLYRNQNGVLDTNTPIIEEKIENIIQIGYNSNSLYYQTTNKTLYNYNLSTNSSNYQNNSSTEFAIDANSQWIYSINIANYSLDRLNKTNLNIDRTLLKSSSNSVGFFDTPTSITSRNNSIYTADSKNNRVSTISSNLYQYNPIEYENQQGSFVPSNPISIAVDSNQTTYTLANDGRSIIKTTDIQNTTLLKDTNSSTIGQRLSGLVVDGQDNLYGYTDTAIYIIDKFDGTPNKTVYSDTPTIVDIYSPFEKDNLYILNSNNQVKNFSNNTLTLVHTLANANSRQIAVDYSQNIFALDQQGILTKYKKDNLGVYATDIQLDIKLTLTGFKRFPNADIAISNAQFTTQFGQKVYNGDMLVLDANTHSLNVVDRVSIGVENAIDYPTPDEADYITADSSQQIIYEAIKNTTLYSQPSTTSLEIMDIQKNDTVIMLVSDLPSFQNIDFDDFAFVMIDGLDNSSGSIITGYIVKQYFSTDNYPYINLGVNSATIREGTLGYLYSHPSLHAKRLSNGTEETLTAGQQVIIHPFADYQRNTMGLKWRRVSIENMGYGYVLANNLEQEANSRFEIKVPNATVIAKSSKVALLSKSNMLPLNIRQLQDGDRVTIVGNRFNPTSKFTNIEYTDRNGVVFNATIESKYLQADAVSVLQISALSLSFILIPLFAIIAFLYYKSCKQRRTIIPEIVEISKDAIVPNISQTLTLDDINREN